MLLSQILFFSLRKFMNKDILNGKHAAYVTERENVREGPDEGCGGLNRYSHFQNSVLNHLTV